MTLIEAIKSGRPFKRKDKRSEWFTDVTMWRHKCQAADDFHGFDWKEEIVADDWEIQEPSVTITRTQFWDGVQAAAKLSGVGLGQVLRLDYAGIEELARRLGLEGEKP